MYKKSLVLVLLAVLTIPIASAANVTLYFDPQHSSALEGCNATVDVMLDIPAGLTVSYGQFGIDYAPTCGDIVDRNFNTDMMTGVDTSWSSWNSIFLKDNCWDNDMDWVPFSFWLPKVGPIQALIGNFTIQGNSTGYCISELNFSNIQGCSQGWTDLRDLDDEPVSFNVRNGTFTCGTSPVLENFSKPLYEGWNLISLPLTPEDGSVSAVLSTVPYDAVYRYNMTTKQFESAEVVDTETGYFVHATADCTWNYSGHADNSMDILLEQGLNMVGWLNCSKDIDVDDALSSISDKYRYVARWNATAEKFEVYNLLAPPAFNDFTAMDRGTGYFISAKQECILSGNC